MSEIIRFETLHDYHFALDTLLAGAQRQIRIYDWDLSDGGYETAERIELLKEFCKRGSGREIRILLADDSYLRQHAGQMMRLLSVWGHVLKIRVRDNEPPPAHDCFVLVDEKAVLKRIDKNNAHGVMYPEAHGDAIDLGLRFDHEWDHAPRRVSAHTLGL